jgi:hypothetical protein
MTKTEACYGMLDRSVSLQRDFIVADPGRMHNCADGVAVWRREV